LIYSGAQGTFKKPEAGAGDAGEPFEKTEMEMPASWVAKLAMERERFQSRCASGARLTVFRKASI